MSIQEAKLVLMTATKFNTPEVWEAYELLYGRKHSSDPDLPQGEKDANLERLYKSTGQTYDAQCCPEAAFEKNPEGTNKIGLNPTPYRLSPNYFATEETANMLAAKLNATAVKLEAPDNAFTWPDAWWLTWATGDSRNAGAVGVLWNRCLDEFKILIDLWNVNLGANNPVKDPQLRTPDVLTLYKLELETGTDLDEDGDVADELLESAPPQYSDPPYESLVAVPTS